MHLIDRITNWINSLVEQHRRDALSESSRKELDMRRLHACILPPGGSHTCIACKEVWPCRTIQILNRYK